jgi:hypothetical protein
MAQPTKFKIGGSGIMRKSFFFSKTVIGAALLGASRVIGDVKNPQAWMEGIGIVWTAYGARAAIAKNAVGQQ